MRDRTEIEAQLARAIRTKFRDSGHAERLAVIVQTLKWVLGIRLVLEDVEEG